MTRLSLFVGAAHALFGPVPSYAGTGPADGLHQSGAETQLRAICDVLIDRAVKRGYGWGWQPDSGTSAAVGGGGGQGIAPLTSTSNGPTKSALSDKGKLPAEVEVSFAPDQSPAATLVLVEAGTALNDERYLQAARMACRGFSAATDGAGRLAGELPFGPGQIGKRSRAGVVADPSPAAAAVAVMLTFERLQPAEHDKVFSATARLVTPLGRLVTATGAVATDEINGRRVVRLDNSRLRDIALAMSLSANIHGDNVHKQALQRIGEFLMRVRATDAGANIGRGLWVTAYDIDGLPVTDVDNLPAQPSMTASAQCATILLLSHLRSGDAASFTTLGQVVDAVVSVRQTNGEWPRLLPASTPPSSGGPPSAQAGTGGPDSTAGTGGLFAAPGSGPGVGTVTGTWGWPPLLKAINDVRLLGRDDFLNITKSVMPLERWAAWTACGIISEPPATDLPVSAREVSGFMKAHPLWFPAGQMTTNASTHDLAQRAIGLLMQVEWERKFGIAAIAPASAPAKVEK